MKKLVLVLMIIGILLSFSNDDDQPQTIDMRVYHYQNTGLGEALSLTLLIQTNNDISSNCWPKLYGSINGFDYQPAYIDSIRAISEQVDNPPADGGSTIVLRKCIT